MKFPKPSFQFPDVIELQREFLCNLLTLNFDFVKKNIVHFAPSVYAASNESL